MLKGHSAPVLCENTKQILVKKKIKKWVFIFGGILGNRSKEQSFFFDRVTKESLTHTSGMVWLINCKNYVEICDEGTIKISAGFLVFLVRAKLCLPPAAVLQGVCFSAVHGGKG